MTSTLRRSLHPSQRNQDWNKESLTEELAKSKRELDQTRKELEALAESKGREELGEKQKELEAAKKKLDVYIETRGISLIEIDRRDRLTPPRRLCVIQKFSLFELVDLESSLAARCDVNRYKNNAT